MTADVAIIVALITVGGVVVTASAAWLVARRQARETRRQASGTVTTSDAATLWDAAEKMRREMREEIIMLRARAVELLEQVDRLERRLAEYERHGR